ncbi:hypothetical protein FACS1894216_02650 [Synergistales bacterium]|nr:hypothetical protein FACS1894216_02650 [Synergistales bacterium]
MSDIQEPRRTRIKLIYEGKDISRDIAPFLLSFDYTDKASGEADDIQITLEDRDGLWRDPWFPSKGDKIAASIITENWDEGSSRSLYCGSFEVDEIEVSEPPMTVSVKAVSAPRSTSMRDESKNKNWEGYKLSGIAGDIAGKAGMSLEYIAEKDPQYDTRNQVEQSDMSFLMKLCSDSGLALKVTDEKIVIFDEEEFEEKAAVSSLKRGDYRIISASLKTKMAGTYKAAHVAYSDSLEDEKFEVYEDDETIDGDNGQTLEINQRVRGRGEAEELAKGKLREANKKEVTGSFTMAGDLGLVAGLNLSIEGYGKFDGKYFIESAKHSYSGSGYTTGVEIREGGPSKKAKKDKKTKESTVKPQLGGNFSVYK